MDFVSCYLDRSNFNLPEKIAEVARRVRGTRASSRWSISPRRNELIKWADRIGEAYNKTFVNNWEYYPLTAREITIRPG